MQANSVIAVAVQYSEHQGFGIFHICWNVKAINLINIFFIYRAQCSIFGVVFGVGHHITRSNAPLAHRLCHTPDIFVKKTKKSPPV
jgi:hypothetical protein